MNSASQASHPAILRVFQSKDQTRAFYNKISPVYDLLSERSEAPMRKAGLDFLQPNAGESILEIGFGTGHTLVSLAEAVGPKGTVFGLDLSEKMAALAKERLAKAGLLDRAKIRCGDATQLPYAASSMDGVFMCFTLELFDTPEIPEVLGKCQRVLRPGGRIVVVGMSSEGPKDPLVNVLEWTHKHFPKYLDCRPIYVRRALEGAGFTIRKAATKHMWIPVEIVLGVKMLAARALRGAKVNLLATRLPIHLSGSPPNLRCGLLPDRDGSTKEALSTAAPLHLKRKT